MPDSHICSIDDLSLKNKKVFIRTDFNVPVQNGKVNDHVRLKSALPTIKYALDHQAQVIIGSHYGRPNKDNKKDFSLEPIGYYLGKHLNCEVIFIESINIPPMLLSSLNEKKIILLENLRFHPEEENADKNWTKKIASYVDVYINEAFSVSHRHHASIQLLPGEVKERAQGFSMKQERKSLDYIRHQSSAPFTLLVGGVKIKDKIKSISQLMDRLDSVLIGGVMAYTFLKAKNIPTGKALVHKAELTLVKEFINRLMVRGKKILLPIDHVVVSKKETTPFTTPGPEIPDGHYPMDIGSKTVELFSKTLQHSKTIFWNGPLGKFEDPLFAKGTLSICSAISKCQQAFRAVGGGDSISAISKLNNQDSFEYISTGGGAALKYLEKGTLPGIQALSSTPVVYHDTNSRPAPGGSKQHFT